MLGQLNDIQIKNILCSQVLGRLACTNGKQPYVIPVTYVFDGKYIYGQTNEGMKLDILRKNPKVCFEVDMMTDMQNWKSAVVMGDFEELKNAAAEKARAILFGRIFSLLTSSTIHPHEHAVSAEPDESNRIKYTLYRIKIKKLTGRFEKQ
jgi:nitroimidazol reductase NimA-like FMN-containing flavoprotein (pyridoxamine 5'-phosphate oxidase superfamily)